MNKEKNVEKKKLKKVLLIVLTIVLLALIVFVINTIRKVVILGNITNAASQYLVKDNIHTKLRSYNDGSMTIYEAYNKDGKYLAKYEIKDPNIKGERSLLMYQDGDEKLNLLTSEESKLILEDVVTSADINLINTVNSEQSIWNKIQLALTYKITKSQCNNKECYLLQNGNWRLYVDSNTGLTVREENGNYIIDKEYEFDIVTDEDVAKPATEGYSLAK